MFYCTVHTFSPQWNVKSCTKRSIYWLLSVCISQYLHIIALSHTPMEFPSKPQLVTPVRSLEKSTCKLPNPSSMSLSFSSAILSFWLPHSMRLCSNSYLRSTAVCDVDLLTKHPTQLHLRRLFPLPLLLLRCQSLLLRHHKLLLHLTSLLPHHLSRRLDLPLFLYRHSLQIP